MKIHFDKKIYIFRAKYQAFTNIKSTQILATVFLTQRGKICGGTELTLERLSLYSCPSRFRFLLVYASINTFHHRLPPPALWPLSSITIRSPLCLSLLCQQPRQPIRSCQCPGASVSHLQQINTEGLSCLDCLSCVFLNVFIYSRHRSEAGRRQ